MKMVLKFFLVASIVTFSPLSAVQADRPITIVADEWPPFSGNSLPNGGISLDVISAVLTKAGYDVSTQVLPWPRVMDGARTGKYDIVGSLFHDAEIEKFMAYGDPFYETQVQFVRKVGAQHNVTGFEDLKPFSIAVGDGFLYDEKFDRANDLNKVVVTTTIQGLQMVAHGRVDLTLDSVEVVRHGLSFDDPSISEMVEVLPFILAKHGIHMAIRRSHPDHAKIVADFNQTLAEMRRDGSLTKLLEKHIVE